MSEVFHTIVTLDAGCGTVHIADQCADRRYIVELLGKGDDDYTVSKTCFHACNGNNTYSMLLYAR